MFARILFEDNTVCLYKNWFGIGSFFVISARGKRKAHKYQAMVIMKTIDGFISAGQVFESSNPKCKEMLEYFAHRLTESPSNLTWRTLYNTDLNKLGKQFAEG